MIQTLTYEGFFALRIFLELGILIPNYSKFLIWAFLIPGTKFFLFRDFYSLDSRYLSTGIPGDFSFFGILRGMRYPDKQPTLEYETQFDFHNLWVMIQKYGTPDFFRAKNFMLSRKSKNPSSRIFFQL